jgi:hypothetical protein
MMMVVSIRPKQVNDFIHLDKLVALDGGGGCVVA